MLGEAALVLVILLDGVGSAKLFDPTSRTNTAIHAEYEHDDAFHGIATIAGSRFPAHQLLTSSFSAACSPTPSARPPCRA